MTDANQGRAVGIIGFGTMGSRLASSLQRTGKMVLGYDSHDGQRKLADKLGVDFAVGIQDLAVRCDAILLVLPDAPDVVTVADELFPHAAPGTLVIDCSTIDPDVSREVARSAAAAQLEFADAGMGGGASNAADGSLLFMVGCRPSAWSRVKELLQPIGRDVVRCGEPGTGVTMKAITNLLWLANYTADVEAVAFAKTAGISPRVAAEVLMATGATNRALKMVADQLIADEYNPGFPVSLAYKDVNLAVAAAERIGLDLTALTPALTAYEAAMKAGLADEGVAAGGLAIEKRLGVDLSE